MIPCYHNIIIHILSLIYPYRLGGAHLFSGAPDPKRDFGQVICSRKKRKVLIPHHHLLALLSSFSPVYWTPPTAIATPQTSYCTNFTTRRPPAPHPFRLPMTPLSLGRHPSICLPKYRARVELGFLGEGYSSAGVGD